MLNRLVRLMIFFIDGTTSGPHHAVLRKVQQEGSHHARPSGWMRPS